MLRKKQVKQSDTSKKVFFYQLPEELDTIIFSEANTKDLYSLGLVSTLFNRISQSDILWKEKIRKDFLIENPTRLKNHMDEPYISIYKRLFTRSHLYLPVALALIEEGKKLQIHIPDYAFRTADIQHDNIHPLLKLAIDCNSYESVLTFLQSVQIASCRTLITHLSKNPIIKKAPTDFFKSFEEIIAHLRHLSNNLEERKNLYYK